MGVKSRIFTADLAAHRCAGDADKCAAFVHDAEFSSAVCETCTSQPAYLAECLDTSGSPDWKKTVTLGQSPHRFWRVINRFDEIAKPHPLPNDVVDAMAELAERKFRDVVPFYFGPPPGGAGLVLTDGLSPS